MVKKKFLFLVQGEGRGHMTQAISTYTMLLKAGHEVCCVMIGINPHREIPDFVRRQMQTEIVSIACPGFVMDAKLKAVKLLPSVLSNFLKLGAFMKSLRAIHKQVKLHKPDMIINFYTPLSGLYTKLYRPAAPTLCIAHQYLYLHPEYVFPEGKGSDKWAIKVYTRFTAMGSARKLALSFYPFSDYSKRNIIAFPPLLRPEVYSHATEQGNYLLTYLVNSGYREEIVKWHKANPRTELHCFSDKPAGELEEDDTLHFHPLNDKKFLQMMAGCRGLVSTAGFESVCEAMYMGKPVFMVPVEGNYEQYCNARDACKTGTGMYDSKFDISRFLEHLPEQKQKQGLFRPWADLAEEKLLEQLRSIETS
jgi:uncharacterized protein (TIGR00661 family)